VRPFLALGLLDLDDHVGLAPDLRGGGRDGGARGVVVLVGEADAHAGVLLDDDLVAAPGEHLDADGEHPDAVLVGLHFAGNTDDHGSLQRGGGAADRARFAAGRGGRGLSLGGRGGHCNRPPAADPV
jgi:hypothetical protein